MTNVFNTLLLALCIADLLVIAANLPLAISVHTQLDMFRSAMQSTVFRVCSIILKLQNLAFLGVLLKMISCGVIRVWKLFVSVTVSLRLKLCSIGLSSVEQYPSLAQVLLTTFKRTLRSTTSTSALKICLKNSAPCQSLM